MGRRIGRRRFKPTTERCPRCGSYIESLQEVQDHGGARDPDWYTIEERCTRPCGWYFKAT